VFHQPHPPAFHDQVHQAGRLLLLTGDLQAYWSGVRTGATTSFAELFPDGAWAAWVPLLLHLYPDGVGIEVEPLASTLVRESKGARHAGHQGLRHRRWSLSENQALPDTSVALGCDNDGEAGRGSRLVDDVASSAGWAEHGRDVRAAAVLA